MPGQEGMQEKVSHKQFLLVSTTEAHIGMALTLQPLALSVSATQENPKSSLSHTLPGWGDSSVGTVLAAQT